MRPIVFLPAGFLTFTIILALGALLTSATLFP
jgi:hypothetical protein